MSSAAVERLILNTVRAQRPGRLERGTLQGEGCARRANVPLSRCSEAIVRESGRSMTRMTLAYLDGGVLRRIQRSGFRTNRTANRLFRRALRGFACRSRPPVHSSPTHNDELLTDADGSHTPAEPHD